MDFSVYIVQVRDVKIFILVYVDDLILVCNNKDKLLKVKEELYRKFEMKDLSDLHFFLSMEVERDHAQHFLYINQIGYLKEIFRCFHITTRNFGFCNCYMQLQFSCMRHMQLQICVVA